MRPAPGRRRESAYGSHELHEEALQSGGKDRFANAADMLYDVGMSTETIVAETIASDPKAVAVVIDPWDGSRFDVCWTWEAGQNYAQAGYVVVAVAADGSMDIDRAQRLYEYERQLFIDCWGRDIPFPE